MEIKLDTVDIWDWWDDKNIEIYQPVRLKASDRDFDYADIERLKDEGELKLKRKLR